MPPEDYLFILLIIEIIISIFLYIYDTFFSPSFLEWLLSQLVDCLLYLVTPYNSRIEVPLPGGGPPDYEPLDDETLYDLSKSDDGFYDGGEKKEEWGVGDPGTMYSGDGETSPPRTFIFIVFDKKTFYDGFKVQEYHESGFIHLWGKKYGIKPYYIVDPNDVFRYEGFFYMIKFPDHIAILAPTPRDLPEPMRCALYTDPTYKELRDLCRLINATKSQFMTDPVVERALSQGPLYVRGVARNAARTIHVLIVREEAFLTSLDPLNAQETFIDGVSGWDTP